MYPSEGLQTALNYMREMSVQDGRVYHQYVPLVTDSTTIGDFGKPILDSANVNVLNDFVSLLRKIVYTAVYNKTFNNPLAELEGERMPLGQFIEDTYVQPAEGMAFDVNDFAGLLEKYEAKVAVQYLSTNVDNQYMVTVTREKIRNAFTSWDNLEAFVSGMVNSLFNGCYVDHYKQAKGLVLSAYTGNNVQVETVSAVNSESTAKALIKKIRATFAKMQIPSTRYNAWNKVKGGDLELKTWSDPQDIVILISADVEANVDVDVLAYAFNMSRADFLARRIVIDDFSVDGVDGSAIQCAIMDRAWFKIKQQDFAVDEFYNMKNRTWQYGLNDVRMVNYSLFANAVVFATSMPTVDATAIEAASATASVAAGAKVTVPFTITPPNATTTVTVSSSAEGKATAEIKGKTVEITGVEAGSATITISAGAGVTDTISVTVTGA